MKRIVVLVLVITIIGFILHLKTQSFELKHIWICNASIGKVEVELIQTTERGNEEVFALYGKNDWNKGLDGVIHGIENGFMDSNECIQIGLCESNKTEIEEILLEYNDNLRAILILAGDSTLKIEKGEISRFFKSVDGVNFIYTIK